MEGGKRTRSKAASKPGKDTDVTRSDTHPATDTAATQSCTDNNASKTKNTEDLGDSEGEESLDLIVQTPALSKDTIGEVAAKTAVPPAEEMVDKRPKIWERMKEAQRTGDTFLAKLLLAAYNNLKDATPTTPKITRSSSALAVLPSSNDILVEKPPPDPKLAETELEDNLIYAVGTVTSHQDIGFTPYFDDNICKLKAPLPLTIFDREWQKKALTAQLLLKPARSSEDKAYRGLAFNDEWTQSHSAWTNNHHTFYITLRDVYSKGIFAEKLRKHKENCDSISDVYGFMTAFRYDMQVRMNAFAHRVQSKDGAALPDISVKQSVMVEQCYKLVKSASYPLNKPGSSSGSFNGNHQERRRENKRWGRGQHQDNWASNQYGFHNYNHEQQQQQPYYNNYNFHGQNPQNQQNFGYNQFQGGSQGSAYHSFGGNNSRKRFRGGSGPQNNQGNDNKKDANHEMSNRKQ
ncbi:hypothetical protein PGTUg99_009055 [Puccinia graminis f. sp. tritici]|uniref:Uncharacterized protein n=1 Tax=Puccinia graminis f. sp. tritici TaxID=56615 RepID=A0A5B0R624_PUCGR|nr:hypothetical protein PGTUg99_009055 [Puccinia graminis f. sp. tritici]